MSTKKDHKRSQEESSAKRNLIRLVQGIALGGIVAALIIPFFFIDLVHINPDGQCVKKIEVKFAEDIERPCKWKEGGRFEEVHVDFPTK